MKYQRCVKRSQGRSLKNFSKLFVGLEQVTMPKSCKLYDDDDDDDDCFRNFGTRIIAEKLSVVVFSANNSGSETSLHVSGKSERLL